MKRILLVVSIAALSKCAKLRGIISEPIALTSQVPTITTTNPTVITSAPTLQVPSIASYQIPITTTPQLISPYAQLGNVYSTMLPTIQTIPSIDYLKTISTSSGVQNLNSNSVATNSQTAFANTSASNGSNANTSMNNNAISTTINGISIPQIGYTLP
jgi:hypothetical protein